MKMTIERIAEAQKLRDTGMSYRKIAKYMGVGYCAIQYNLSPGAKERRVEYMKGIKEKTLSYNRSYREANRERLLAWDRDYAASHKEEKATYRRDNKDKIAAKNKRYREDNAAYFAASTAERRAIKKGFLLGATAAQKAEIKEIYRKAKEDQNVRCYLCGDLIKMGDRQVDHILPLSKNGLHRPSNLAVACSSCNLRKNDKLPEEVGILL